LLKPVQNALKTLKMYWHCWLGISKSIQHGYLSGARCKWFAYGPADATATHCLLLQ